MATEAEPSRIERWPGLLHLKRPRSSWPRYSKRPEYWASDGLQRQLSPLMRLVED